MLRIKTIYLMIKKSCILHNNFDLNFKHTYIHIVYEYYITQKNLNSNLNLN